MTHHVIVPVFAGGCGSTAGSTQRPMYEIVTCVNASEFRQQKSIG